jgi:mRNA-degrading endonuclease RelE of RelBE toxin-antitoxin system
MVLPPAVEKAVGLLEHEAEIETLQRRRLKPDASLENPEPIWRIRVGEHRVLYAVDGQTVRVLRVILKGRKAFGESL